ncbi:MAG: hypothetical protein AAGB04_26300 [Pseudomonadota bacterium]
MDFIVNENALALGGYQAALAIVGILVLLWLSWRATSAIIKRSRNKTRMTEREVLAYAWPPMAWLALLLIGGVAFSTMQAYGPRIAIPKTELKVNAPAVPGGAQVQDLTPKKLSDNERLDQQRQLEAETKKRVNLQ